LTAHDALLLFGIGMPTACLMLIVVDRLGRPGGRFVPRRYDDAAERSVRAGRVPATVPPPARAAADPGELPAEPDAVHVVQAVPGVHALVASLRPPRPVRRPWAPGDGLRHPIAGGAAPSAATVRKRAWTTYSVIAPSEIFGAINAERLQRGRPPLRFNPLQLAMEPMQVDVDEVGRVRVHWSDADDVVDPFELTRSR
jgi:hypothetical protein